MILSHSWGWKSHNNCLTLVSCAPKLNWQRKMAVLTGSQVPGYINNSKFKVVIIDKSTSHFRDISNMAVFWRKRSSKNHCSQWEPCWILLLFLKISLNSLFLFRNQLALISLYHIWVKIMSNYSHLLFKLGYFPNTYMYLYTLCLNYWFFSS